MNAPAPAPALALRALHKSYGASVVLRGVDLALQPGERVALIGPNGAGKSTLLDLISGRQAPSSGQVWLHGQRVDGWAPQRIYRQGLGRSFQVSQLFGTLSVRDNLRCSLLWRLGHGYAFWRRLAHLRAVNAQVEQLLAQLGLQEGADTPAAQLGYAEQRALELGMAVAGPARVLLLDEPTAGMSAAQAQRMVALIRQLCAGRTLLLVEHDMEVVFGLAERIAVLVAGEVIAFDRPETVRANAQVQAAYLGGLDAATA